jgi:hypothetical protein
VTSSTPDPEATAEPTAGAGPSAAPDDHGDVRAVAAAVAEATEGLDVTGAPEGAQDRDTDADAAADADDQDTEDGDFAVSSVVAEAAEGFEGCADAAEDAVAVRWVPQHEQPSQALLNAVELARSVAVELAGADAVGAHESAEAEDGYSVTHYFTADQPGYRGWRWAVTLADGGDGTPVTVSEAALLPGAAALVAPTWVPWQDRVRAGDLGVGDLLPSAPDDLRLVPGYLESDDPAVEEIVREVGLGRVRVLSRFGREEAGERWLNGARGPRADMARAAPGTCGTCGFYLPLAGSMSAAFGVCANEYAPADGAVVHTSFGCGAHSDVEAEPGSPTPIAELVFDDGVDLETR